MMEVLHSPLSMTTPLTLPAAYRLKIAGTAKYLACHGREAPTGTHAGPARKKLLGLASRLRGGCEA